MQKLRKSLAALLAVVMLISVFTFSASAGVDALDPGASQNLAMKLEVEHTDGTAATSVNPGETVTVNVYVTAKDPAARIAGGMFLIFWNSDVYTYVDGSRTWGLSSVDPESLYAVNNTQVAYTTTVGKFTEEEKSYGWNIAGNFQVTNAAGTTNANASLIQENSATPFISIKLKVSDSVLPGTAAPIGIPTTAIAPATRKNYTYLQTWTDASTTITQNKNASLYVMDTIAKDLAVAAETPAAPSVVKSAGQIKMTATSATTVEDAFQLRITSKITAADWDANFANTAVDSATANYITKVGMVAYTGAADAYSLDEAKAAIAAGADSGDYYYGATDYINHAEGGDATFGTVLKCTHGGEKLQNDPICLGFVSYVDADGNPQTIYYAETYTAPIVSNYDTLASDYAGKYFGK